MSLPDPARSQAVLIGAWQYETMAPLPAVENNLTRLASLLADGSVCGLPADHVHVLANPSSPSDVLRTLHDAARVATDTLIVYFAGHGLTDPLTFELYLSLSRANESALHEAVRYDDVRRTIVRDCRAFSKVVILDCCYAGGAMVGGMGTATDVADQARFHDDGTYLMTATAETMPALAEPGETYTAFTGELIDALSTGIAGKPDLLDMGTLYWHVRSSLTSKQRPQPQERAQNAGRAITIARNRWGRATDTRSVARHKPARRAPEPPAGYEYLLRRPPREVVAQVNAARAAGEDTIAEQILVAVAASRQDQEVASLLLALGAENLTADMRVVIGEAALRSAPDLVALESVLLDIGADAQAAQLLEATAATSAENVAEVASELRAADRTTAAVALLDAAAAAHPTTAGTIQLVAALWSAGLGDEIDRWLAAATTQLSDAETIELADELRAVGREEPARQLYLSALTTVVLLPCERLASIAQSVSRSASSEQVDELFTAILDAAPSDERIMELAGALWILGAEDLATGFLEAAASRVTDTVLIKLIDALWTQDRQAIALRMASLASTSRTAQTVVALTEILRDLGRPVDALTLLDALADAPAEHVAAVLLALDGAGDERGAQRLLDTVFTRPADDLVRIVTSINTDRQDTDAANVIALLARQEPAKVAALLRQLRTASHHAIADRVLEQTALRSNDAPAALVRALADAGLPSELAMALIGLVRRSAINLLDAFVAAIIEYDQSRQIIDHLTTAARPDHSEVATIVSRFRAAQGDEFIQAWLAQTLEYEATDITAYLAALHHLDEHDIAAQLIAGIAKTRGAYKLPIMLQTLRSAGHTDDLAALLDNLRRYRPEADVGTVARVLRRDGHHDEADRLQPETTPEKGKSKRRRPGR